MCAGAFPNRVCFYDAMATMETVTPIRSDREAVQVVDTLIWNKGYTAGCVAIMTTSPTSSRSATTTIWRPGMR